MSLCDITELIDWPYSSHGDTMDLTCDWMDSSDVCTHACGSAQLHILCGR